MSGTLYVNMATGIQAGYDDGRITLSMDDTQAIRLYGLLYGAGYDNKDINAMRSVLSSALNHVREE